MCFTNTEKQKANRLKSDSQSRTVQRLQSGTRCHDPSADKFEFCSGTLRSMESSNLEEFARAIENSLVRRILQSRVRSEEVPIDGSTFPPRKLISSFATRTRQERSFTTSYPPVDDGPANQNATPTSQHYALHGAHNLRDLVGPSNLHPLPPRNTTRPAHRLQHHLCDLHSSTQPTPTPRALGVLSRPRLHHLESPPRILRPLRPAESLDVHAKLAHARSNRQMHRLLGHTTARGSALQTRELQILLAAYGRIRANGLSAVQDAIVRRPGLACAGGYEDCGCFYGS